MLLLVPLIDPCQQWQYSLEGRCVVLCTPLTRLLNCWCSYHKSQTYNAAAAAAAAAAGKGN